MSSSEERMVCIANKDVDFSIYGFKKDGKEWIYHHNNTRRIYFNTKDYVVRFNGMTTQVLYTFFKLSVAGAIRFEVCKKEQKMYLLTDEEFKLIQEMRRR